MSKIKKIPGTQIQNITGMKFGKLTAIKFSHIKNGSTYWICQCKCGNVVVFLAGNLRKGNTKSCGCSKRTKNGMANTPTCRSWYDMHRRCSNKKDISYDDYGGRGIKICDRWSKFENFFKDMGHRPDNLSLDRIDNDGPYSPENCKWSTPKQQANNKRSNKNIKFNNKSKNLTQWSEYLKINRETLSGRLERGWSIKNTFTVKPDRTNSINRLRGTEQ